MTDPIYYALVRNPEYEETFPIEIRKLIFEKMHRVDRSMWKWARRLKHKFKWTDADMVYCMSVEHWFAVDVRTMFGLDRLWTMKNIISSGNIELFQHTLNATYTGGIYDMIDLASAAGQCDILSLAYERLKYRAEKFGEKYEFYLPEEVSFASIQYLISTHKHAKKYLYSDWRFTGVRSNITRKNLGVLQWLAEERTETILTHASYSPNSWINTAIRTRSAEIVQLLLDVGLKLPDPRYQMRLAIRVAQSLEIVKVLVNYVHPIDDDLLLALQCSRFTIFKYFVSIGCPVSDTIREYARAHKMSRFLL